jgi:serine acetyltransferase
VSRVNKDISATHLRRWPGRPMTLTSRLWLLATSRSLQFLLLHRMEHWLYSRNVINGGHKWVMLFIRISLLPLILANKVLTKSEIRCDCEIEGGVCFSDQGYIIFGVLKAGTGTVIDTRVTIGQSHVDGGLPEIGRNVWIGSDCVVYGAISIGDGATLLPGTVLTKSIPAGVVMQGNPARLVCRDFDNSELRLYQNLDAMHYVKTKRGG